MKVLVIGGTHGIGLETTKLALERGHEVVVLARRPERMTLAHPALLAFAGDIRDAPAVEAAVRGCAAVCVSIFVGPSFRRLTTASQGTRNTVHAMSSQGLRRLLVVTGIGAGESRGHGGFLYDHLMRSFLLKSVYDDKERQEELARASDLDWTIVRPGFLTNGRARHRYRALTALDGFKAGWISRADVADFILRELETPAHLREAVLLTD